ncbi:hypothetical protein [Streptomyces syringium]|uniref:hypothetical protein n=1 Tax=Streptomyces syringium TaxID=76729 RepID=UPI0034519598
MSTDDIAERFQRNTAEHQMTVLHDDGLYRHVRFDNLQYNGIYGFDLITWPNNLAIRGDGVNFMFTIYPTVDLFDLFRQTSHGGGINPGYWQEKVVAGEVKSWSEEKFRTWLIEEAAGAEARYPGLVQAVGDQILHSDEHSTEYEATARHAVASFCHGDFRFYFPDEWELSFDDYDSWFLWACHAIVWGIAQYDAAKQKPVASPPEDSIQFPEPVSAAGGA